jgi:Flp pilus assembly protein TadG
MLLPVSRQFFRDRRGNVAMMYALALPVLMFAAGLAIDFTHAAQVRTELNAAADAAVLAALTPSMMQQSNATAQTAALNMFNGEIANISSLAAGQTNVTISVTNPSNNTLERIVTVSFTAQNSNIFAGILGAATMTLYGTSTASASIAANINFYMLLDNSPSMALPATQAGITQMENLTPQQGSCAFACHQASTNNGDSAGNPCLSSSGNYTNPTLTSSGRTGGNTYCASTQGSQIDDFALARLNGVQLRLDALSTGISDLMTDAHNAQQLAASTPPVYQFGAYMMDSSWQIGMSSSNNYNQLMALTTNYVSGWSTAAPNFTVMQYYANNAECGNSACTSSGGGGDYATNYDNALGAMNTIMPNPGNGTNVTGDTPQEVLFFVTDGVEDEVNSTCSQPLSGNRCQAPIDPTLCTTIKNRGIRIAILYTDYYQVTANSWYEQWIAPFQPNISTALQSCASPNLFYDASIGTDLGSALQTLFNTVTQTAHLTN